VWYVQLPAGGAASSQQYLLPAAATHNLHAPACYNPAAAVAAGFLQTAGISDVSAAAAAAGAPAIASHNNNNAVSDVIDLVDIKRIKNINKLQILLN